MTTQVIISTTMGVAVASDSLLTVTLDSEPSSRKSLGNSRKIHELGEQHKVLVLSSGDVILNGIPIELFVLRWSQQMTTPLASVESYVHSFLGWLSLNSTGKNRSDEEALHHAASHLPWRVYQEIQSRLDVEANPEFSEMPYLWDPSFGDWYSANPDSAKKYAKTARESVEFVLKEVETFYTYELFTEATCLKLLSAEVSKSVIASVFSDRALQPSVRQKLISAMPSALRRRISDEGPSTTLVFTGFGTESFTPQAVSLKLEGALPEMVLGWVEKRFDGIDGTNIFYPAQRRAINTFFSGYDPELYADAEKLVDDAIFKATIELYKSPSELEKMRALQQEVSSKEALAEGVREYLTEFARAKNSKLLDTIGAMDLTGVAEVAESLTGLEVLAAHNDDGSPSSGGIIEVATIDLQYGIQWHRRIPRGKAGLSQEI